jgi:hypothetical protein
MTTTAYYFSVIASRAPTSVGKTYSIADGKLTKTSVASITKGVALTFPATAENFVGALRHATESNNLALVLDSFIGATPDSPQIQVVTEDRLQSLTGGKIGDTNGQGFFSIGGAIISARLKRLMQGSGWILLDADSPEGMPEDWTRLTLAERLTRLEPVLPGISTCRRIEYLGSSARVVNGSGAAKPEATHALIEISDPARLTLLRNHVRVESVRQAYRSRRRVAHARAKARSLASRISPWSTGRFGRRGG